MKQLTFAEAEYNTKKRKKRREKFLDQMDALIPWKQLERKIQRYYPQNGHGRQPYPLSVMLRAHCMQLFYNLSDPAMEDSLYEIESMRKFAGLSLSGPIPDETTEERGQIIFPDKRNYRLSSASQMHLVLA